MEKSEANQAVHFGLYEITGCKGQVLQRNRPLALSPKAVAVLWTLVQRPGQVVSKDDLFNAVWPETVVTEGVLTSRIRELRQALGDATARPRYIETVSRRGYRFIAPVAAGAAPVSSSTFKVPRSSPPPTSDSERETPTISQPGTWNLKPETLLVGREAELAQLHNLFAKAVNGARQVVFVTGEAGIGKTALVDTFLGGFRSGELGSGEQKSQEANGKRQSTKVSEAQSSALSPQSLSFLNPKSPIPNPGSWVARGQCIEHYGVGEAYLPVLEAIGRLCQQPEGGYVLQLLRRVAPTWLAQLPALLDEAEYVALQQKAAGVTRERMLREMADALEALSTRSPLILILEDLHWGDASTVDLLAMVARRQEAARLMILGTYRPAELIVTNHPLKQLKHELVARGQGREIPLTPLTVADVRAYLARRFSEAVDVQKLTSLIYQRTEGHPLFMVQMADYLAQQKMPVRDTSALAGVAQALPQGLRELIEAQVGRLTAEERQTLEAASVAGAEFALASVAAGMGSTGEEIEAVCERLAQRGQFIAEHELEPWPDGTVSGRYKFRHALYQEVLYQRLSASRRARLHTAIGERLERGYGARASELAAELAMHFERGSDLQRAVRYLQQAGEKALNRSAQAEAIALLSHALVLLRSWPDTPERVQQDLALHLLLGPALVASKGHGAPEVEQVYRRAAALCEQLPHYPQHSAILSGLGGYYMAHGDFAATFALGEQLLPLAQQDHQPHFEIQARRLLGTPLFWQGRFVAAREHLERGIELAKVHSAPLRSAFPLDPGVACRSYASFTLWALGYSAQAVSIIQEAVTVAQRLLDPHSLAFALEFVSRVHLLRREGVLGQQYAETLQAQATEYSFSYFQRQGLFDHGWALVEQGQAGQGITLIRQALAALQEIGIRLGHSQVLTVLGEACGQVGQSEEGLQLIGEALTSIEQSGERVFEAELYRLKGELTLQQLKMKNVKLKMTEAKDQGQKAKVPSTQHLTPSTQAVAQEVEGYFLKAINIARQQQAKSLELRAVMSLVRLRQQQLHDATRTTQHGARTTLAEAHSMLSEVYGWFTEGFETKDLQEAKALLESLRV